MCTLVCVPPTYEFLECVFCRLSWIKVAQYLKRKTKLSTIFFIYFGANLFKDSHTQSQMKGRPRDAAVLMQQQPLLHRGGQPPQFGNLSLPPREERHTPGWGVAKWRDEVFRWRSLACAFWLFPWAMLIVLTIHLALPALHLSSHSTCMQIIPPPPQDKMAVPCFSLIPTYPFAVLTSVIFKMQV